MTVVLWRRVAAQRFIPGEESEAEGRWMPPMHRTTPTEGGDYDNNWAGPVLASGSWSSVIGSWTVPTLSMPKQPPRTIYFPDGE
jgi:hypothetical protein